MAKKLRSASSVAEKFIESTPQGLTLEEQEARGQQPLIKEQEGEQAQPKEEKPEPEQAEPTKETEAREAQDEPSKKTIGQPRKYTEPTKHVSFALPLSVIEDLKILASLKQTNQTQLILGMIKNEIAIEADKIQAYKELLK